MQKQIVLLTGASSGIGERIAHHLVQTNQYFPILIARNQSKLKSLQKEIVQCDYFACDVTNSQQIQSMITQILSKYGQIDVLINNAGYGTFGGVLDTSPDDFRGMMETNYLGAIRLVQAVLPSMLQRGNGKIINIASIAGLTGVPNLTGYSASKFALIGFSESLQLEFSPQIQVGVLCPGPVQTPFFKGKEATTLFPPLIARQLIDADTVARETVKLIKRPRIKIIPSGMYWMMLAKRLAPGLYSKMTKKIYDAFFHNEKQSQSHSITEST
ncbi:SDR family NAD(P)-dependent oxidoreductase [Thermoflavimicrobium dichotomicum]|uniref:Short-chain dehydrogenase n=1 Tax=Thermoflavimicrobium dichotomicum TaxID=46223 RepID=A0A1I3PTA5_9BACL|nr:SDR family oxidoreductase [Thermoflavimicrobium dichotomicum]SFJ24176.1 hypothetical protein SAMN05421852_10690 [Thermoflavimicrobium dichotomicum]